MKLSLSLFAALSLAAFAGCGGDSPTDPGNNDNGTFFPLTTGTNWSYSVQDVGLDGNLTGPVTTDSLVVTGQQFSYDGHTGTAVAAYHISDSVEPADTTYYYTENNAVYQLLPVGLSEVRWLKLIDANATGSWDVVDATVPFELFGTGQMHIKTTAAKVGSESITTPAGTFNAVHYTQTTVTTFDVVFVTTPAHAVQTSVTHFYHMPGVGIVKIKEDPSTVEGDDSFGPSEGELNTLVRYSVK